MYVVHAHLHVCSCMGEGHSSYYQFTWPSWIFDH